MGEPDSEFIETRRPACEACGREFGCGAGSGGRCWCDQQQLAPEVAAQLRERYGDCLCPDCLAQAATAEPTV